MILLRALKQIPNSVASIEKNQTFYESNPEQEQYWIKEGYAEPAVKLVDNVPKVNSRGWDGLMWDGSTVCILASGPSLTEEQVQAARTWRSEGEVGRVIVINTTFQLAPWADVLYACDARWWDMYIGEVREKFLGQSWTQDQAAKDKYEDLHLVKSEREEGLSKRPGVIRQGMSSGFQSMNLAYQAGARKILLLGFDCQDVDKKQHWHGDHPSPIKSTQPYNGWLRHFAKLAVDLKEVGVEVVNLTPNSALKSFSTASWQEILLPVKLNLDAAAAAPLVTD